MINRRYIKMKLIHLLFVLSRGRTENSVKNRKTLEGIISGPGTLKKLMLVYVPDIVCEDLVSPYTNSSKVHLKAMPEGWMDKMDFDTAPEELVLIENEAVKNDCDAILFLSGANASCNLISIIAYVRDCYDNAGPCIPMYPTELLTITGNTWSKTMKEKP